ncbi:MAG: hypothetical protein ACLTYW_04835 [Collinsella sp.]
MGCTRRSHCDQYAGPKREKGATAARVPLPWVAADDPVQGGSFGFSPADADAVPHLPQPAWFSDYAADREEADPTSMLALYRDALWLAQLRGAPTILRGSILTGAPALRMVPRALRAASSPIAATTAGRV